MNISLDYDKTFTADPDFWSAFLTLCKKQGHVVLGITMRNKNELDDVDNRYLTLCDEVHPTDRQAKIKYVNEHNLVVDVWIDDNPHAIFNTYT